MIDLKKLLTQTQKLSILIVEDYKPLLEEMRNILSDYFLLVDTASNGREALELYREYHDKCGEYYDIIISDIEMPLMDGIELTRELREINKEQKIIILSAYTDSRYLLSLINLSISQFIPKPIESDTLFEAIYRLTKEISVTDSTQKSSEAIVDLGEEYIWCRDELLLKHQDKVVKLSRSLSLLMQLLVEKNHSICTNEYIVRHFYEHDIYMGEDNIRNLIYRLRRILPKDTIESHYGIGYKITPMNNT
ncbi:two component transcriptional regulator, winged helix family [hydrothermal vent metagenome]|uniref:Two component transcriptional regulator, winged helix family n=1 Tax=hydrothermal vent metagenome TaxID=652676 RepID=A0A1W1BG19_9ZZZZ